MDTYLSLLHFNVAPVLPLGVRVYADICSTLARSFMWTTEREEISVSECVVPFCGDFRSFHVTVLMAAALVSSDLFRLAPFGCLHFIRICLLRPIGAICV